MEPRDKSNKSITVTAYLDNLGVEFICDALMNGFMLTEIAKNLNVDRSDMMKWIRSNPERNQAVIQSRMDAADAWDDKAEIAILSADNPLDLARARELAQHYRWRASKLDPRRYGKNEESDSSSDVKIVGGLPD